ncbi:synaptotagmin-8-like [Galendromus occidentalis]|uniref:Synaptotagmin-8-like n=1 Tax=Galendromus occidentalis TaxID=34638 RepID=A0AAJ7P9Q7_9ACAR|nr:synaptotagmin-8-like [Galendromus occidentalis]
MIFAAIPDSSETTPISTSAKLVACIAVFILLGSLISAMGYYLIRSMTFICSQKKEFEEKPKPPILQFDLTPRITIEESIDFVVPALQSPRTLMAGAGMFESGSTEQLQKNLYEPTARAYRPPSIGFTVEYDREVSSTLTVRLNGAKDIPPSKLGVNPIVKISLSPDKIKHVSRLQRDTIRPVFGDVFQFDLPEDANIETRSLKFTLYDQDKLNKRPLGRAVFPLKKTMHQSERWISLNVQQCRERSYGEVTVQLEQNDALFVCSLLSVRGIPNDIFVHVKLGVYVNHKPYKKVRSSAFQALGGIMSLKERIELQKSDFGRNDLSTLQIIVSLHSRKKRLAKCHIGPRSSVDGMEHWAEMLLRNNAIKAHRFLSG